jgi:hypothetical protein
VTVEAVAKGVRERANEEADPERMTGDEARGILSAAEARRAQAAGQTTGQTASQGASQAATAGSAPEPTR